MKIAFIGQKGIPATSGGIERHVEELATRLVRAGHEVFVYTRPNYINKKLKVYKGVNLISLSSLPTKHLDAISHTFLACFDVVFRKKVDVIHFQSIGPSSLIWLVKLLKPNIPVVATFHTQCYYHQKWNCIARWYLKFGELVLCQISDQIIAVFKILKKYINDKYDQSANYIPNGVARAKIVAPNEITKKWNLKKDSYILTVSRLVRHKGIHHLIKAYQKIETNKKLVIVGSGSFTDDYVQELKKLASKNKNIIFTGEQRGIELQELFSNAYLFVQPSESEGLSIALLEAMSYGRVSLVSNISENKEAIGRAGMTFRDKDVNDLAKKIKYVLENKFFVKGVGSKSKKRVKIEYDWGNITNNTIAVYEDVLAEKNKKSIFLRLKLARKFLSLL